MAQVDEVLHHLPHAQDLVDLDRIDVVAGAEGLDDDQGYLLGDIGQEPRLVVFRKGIVEDDAVHLPGDEVVQEAPLVLDQLGSLPSQMQTKSRFPISLQCRSTTWMKSMWKWFEMLWVMRPIVSDCLLMSPRARRLGVNLCFSMTASTLRPLVRRSPIRCSAPAIP
jgi:hypothetical protein